MSPDVLMTRLLHAELGLCLLPWNGCLTLCQYIFHVTQIRAVLEFFKPLEVLGRDHGSDVLAMPLHDEPLVPKSHFIQNFRESLPRLTCW